MVKRMRIEATKTVAEKFILGFERERSPMATSFTMLKDLDASSDQQNWCLKVRVIKKWSISTVEDKYRRPILEMIVMDQMGHRIQCSIHRRFFENDRTEGRLYSLTNFSLAANDEKYKPTFRALRIYFKRETQFCHVDDINFPTNVFHFVPNELI
ncbi:hypothetical protein AHAS_Ahas09G0212000 [Arachis hypogaea]